MFIRILFVIVAALLLSLPAYGKNQHALGDEINNGASLAELNLRWVYQNLATILNIDKIDIDNELTSVQRTLLLEIKNAHAGEINTPNQLEVLSGADHPHIFYLDGEFKIAVTGDHVGTKIYINKDLIYETVVTENGNKIKSLTKSDFLAILIHEFGHHHGDHSHDFLDELGVFVAGKVKIEDPILTNPFHNCQNSRVPPATYKIRSLLKFPSALKCQGPTAPLGSPIRVSFQIFDEQGNPAPKIAFTPVVFGALSSEKTSNDYLVRFPDGSIGVAPASMAGIVTPKRELCSDSNGIMAYVIWPTCVNGQSSTVVTNISAGSIMANQSIVIDVNHQ